MGKSTSKLDLPLRNQYRAERIHRIIRITKYSAPLYIVIVGLLFIYSDLYVSNYPWAPKWRLPSIIIALLLLILVNSRYRNHYRLIYASYLAFLFCICLMMAGLTWEIMGDMDLNKTLSGVLLAIFVVYIGAIGGARILVLLYLPLIILPIIVFSVLGIPTEDFILYANPLALMVTCLIASQVDENLRFREFKSRKTAENERTKADKAYDDLKSTQSQLIHSEKMASLGELTAGIAHEIQNPLNFVNNFSDVNKELAEELLEEIKQGNGQEAQAIIKDIIDNEEKILHHGKRADGIVKGMLQHSRAGGGEKESSDINALCDEYLRLAYHGLRAKDKSFNAEFKIYLDPDLPKVNAVPQDIGRVLLNLINNAFYAVSLKPDAGSKGYKPEVVVSTKRVDSPIGAGGSVEISIKDNGPGIPEDIKDKIFQPFFTTKATGEGTGLGLSLSYDIVTKGHGGTIDVKSKVGKGTEFIITLPVE